MNSCCTPANELSLPLSSHCSLHVAPAGDVCATLTLCTPSCCLLTPHPCSGSLCLLCHHIPLCIRSASALHLLCICTASALHPRGIRTASAQHLLLCARSCSAAQGLLIALLHRDSRLLCYAETPDCSATQRLPIAPLCRDS